MFRSLVKLAISIFLIFHFWVVIGSMISQRGTSPWLDGWLSHIAFYSVVGNWRPDTAPLSMVSATQCGERLDVEVHHAGDSADSWKALSILSGTNADLSKATNQADRVIERRWLQMLNGLLFYENNDGISRMLVHALIASQRGTPYSSTSSNLNDKQPTVHSVRVLVSARPTYEAFQVSGSDPSQSETVYAAQVVDLGEGQISLVPELKDHRASKSLSDPKKQDSGLKP